MLPSLPQSLTLCQPFAFTLRLGACLQASALSIRLTRSLGFLPRFRPRLRNHALDHASTRENRSQNPNVSSGTPMRRLLPSITEVQRSAPV